MVQDRVEDAVEDAEWEVLREKVPNMDGLNIKKKVCKMWKEVGK